MTWLPENQNKTRKNSALTREQQMEREEDARARAARSWNSFQDRADQYRADNPDFKGGITSDFLEQAGGKYSVRNLNAQAVGQQAQTQTKPQTQTKAQTTAQITAPANHTAPKPTGPHPGVSRPTPPVAPRQAVSRQAALPTAANIRGQRPPQSQAPTGMAPTQQAGPQVPWAGHTPSQRPPESKSAWGRIDQAIGRGAEKSGWTGPLGYDDPNLANMPVVGQVARSLDAAARLASGLPHGVVQAAEEIGGSPAKQFAQDIMAMPEAFAGNPKGALDDAGQIARHARNPVQTAQASADRLEEAGYKALEPIDHFFSTEHQLRRLVKVGGKDVLVWELTDDQYDAISKVVPESTANAFRSADGRLYATEGLLNSLRDERKKHAERLIMGMPKHLEEGEIIANPQPNRQHRPVFARPGPPKGTQPRWDMMPLDVRKGKVSPPTIMTGKQQVYLRGKNQE